MLALPDKPSIAVLPFQNMSPDPPCDLWDVRALFFCRSVMAVTKTEEQLREEILGQLRDLGLFEDPGQLKAVE